jgi:hypothetical protein
MSKQARECSGGPARGSSAPDRGFGCDTRPVELHLPRPRADWPRCD